MKKNKSNPSWVHAHINDPYVKMAQKDGYRARAAYKLKEIDDEYHLIKSGIVVVDLGSTPGSWSQVVREKLVHQGQMNGRIIALDLLAMAPIEGVVFLQGDFRDIETLQKLEQEMQGRKADVVVSDMAPNLSGIPSVDAARVSDLIELAVDFAQQHLKPSGALVVKLFHGSGYDALVHLFRAHFEQVKPIKPKASRDKSSETFLVGLGLKQVKPA